MVYPNIKAHGKYRCISVGTYRRIPINIRRNIAPGDKDLVASVWEVKQKNSVHKTEKEYSGFWELLGQQINFERAGGCGLSQAEEKYSH